MNKSIVSAVMVVVGLGLFTAGCGQSDQTGGGGGGNCHPSYDPCLPANASDVDCRSGTGNGPSYAPDNVSVNGSDPYGLDGDGDGVGCEPWK